MNAILKQLGQLGTYEKLELVEALWDSIGADEFAEPMSDTVFEELERRSQWGQAHPEQGKSIEQIAAGLGVILRSLPA